MAEEKKSFILYADLIHTVQHLSNEDAGELLKHVLEYVNDNDPDTNNPIVKVAFEPIKQQLKRDLKHWESIKKKRSEAGKKSANKRKQTSTNSTSVKSVKQTSTNSTVNDNVTVNVNVTSIDDRKLSFQQQIKNHAKDHPGKYPKQLYLDFYHYWSEHGINDKKMRFEKEKSFGLDRRLSTWFNRDTEGKYEVKKEKVFIPHWNQDI